MKRITQLTTAGAGIWDEQGNSILPSDIYRNNPMYHTAIIKAFNKLAEYESTGMEPDEIKQLLQK